jgi:hypothetical protein
MAFVIAEGNRRIRRRRLVVSASVVVIAVAAVAVSRGNLKPATRTLHVTPANSLPEAVDLRESGPSAGITGTTASAPPSAVSTTATPPTSTSPSTQGRTAQVALSTAPTTAPVPTQQPASSTSVVAVAPVTTTSTAIVYVPTPTTEHKDCTEAFFEQTFGQFFAAFDAGDFARVDAMISPAGEFNMYSFAPPYGNGNAGYNRAYVIDFLKDMYNGGVRVDPATVRYQSSSGPGGVKGSGNFSYPTHGSGKAEVNCTSLRIASLVWGAY